MSLSRFCYAKITLLGLLLSIRRVSVSLESWSGKMGMTLISRSRRNALLALIEG